MVRSIDLGWHGSFAEHAAGEAWGLVFNPWPSSLSLVSHFQPPPPGAAGAWPGVGEHGWMSLASLSRGCRGPLQATIQNKVWGLLGASAVASLHVNARTC